MTSDDKQPTRWKDLPSDDEDVPLDVPKQGPICPTHADVSVQTHVEWPYPWPKVKGYLWKSRVYGLDPRDWDTVKDALGAEAVNQYAALVMRSQLEGVGIEYLIMDACSRMPQREQAFLLTEVAKHNVVFKPWSNHVWSNLRKGF